MKNKTKQCSCCGKIKELPEFSKCARSKDGFTGQCKNCRNAKNRIRNKKNVTRRSFDDSMTIRQKSLAGKQAKKRVEYASPIIELQEEEKTDAISFEDAMHEINGY